MEWSERCCTAWKAALPSQHHRSGQKIISKTGRSLLPKLARTRRPVALLFSRTLPNSSNGISCSISCPSTLPPDSPSTTPSHRCSTAPNPPLCHVPCRSRGSLLLLTVNERQQRVEFSLESAELSRGRRGAHVKVLGRQGKDGRSCAGETDSEDTRVGLRGDGREDLCQARDLHSAT